MSRLRVLCVCLLSAFAVAAVASASATAGPLHWYQGGVKLAEGPPLSISGVGGLQSFKDTIAGISIETDCSHLHLQGTITNPAGGGAGTTLSLLLYLGCVVDPTSLECKIPEAMVHIHVKGVLQGTNAEPRMEVSPQEGTTFVRVNFEGCKSSGLNGTYEFTGAALAKLNNSTSELEINEPKAGSMLKFAGTPASLVGSFVTEMEGGGRLEAKE